jgi:hypothetical protein
MQELSRVKRGSCSIYITLRYILTLPILKHGRFVFLAYSFYCKVHVKKYFGHGYQHFLLDRMHWWMSVVGSWNNKIGNVLINVTFRRICKTVENVCLYPLLSSSKLCCHLQPVWLYRMFPHYLKTAQNWKSYLIQNVCFDFLYSFCLKHFSFGIRRDIISVNRGYS